MNPLQTLIAFINQWIYANGNNEITANTLNPVLQAIAQWANGVMGDPSQLNTATQANLVAAINEINSAISNINSTGIQLLSGTTNPNETPPASFNTADFYILTTVLGNPVELYQYNGYTWVSTQQAGGDGSTITALNPVTGLTDLLDPTLQDIYDATFDDELISIGTITQNGALPAEITIPAAAEWRINNTEYTNAAAFVTEIDTEADGFRRVDIIVATVTGFQVIQGTPDNLGVAVQPITPIDTILISVIQIDGLVIGVPTQPETGGKYVTKESKGFIAVVADGNLPRQAQTGYQLVSGTSVDGIAAASSEAQDGLYDGQSYFLWNDTGADVTLKHLAAGGEIKIHFSDLTDYILPTNTIAHFVFIKAAAPRIYFVGSKAVNGIPLTGTEVGSPVTGAVEMDGGSIVTATRNFGSGGQQAIYITEEDGETGVITVKNTYTLDYITIQNGFIEFSTAFVRIKKKGAGTNVDMFRLELDLPSTHSRGLSGLQDFTPNITALDFTQKKYVDDAIAAAAIGAGAVSGDDVLDIAARDAYDIPALPFTLFVEDDGDGKWALYMATTIGVGATFVKISDPDLLNAVMSNAAIKTAYESNADTNAFTDTEKTKLATLRTNTATDLLLDAKENKLSQTAATYAATFTVDFNQADAVQTIALTGDITFADPTNKAAAKAKEIELTADGTTRTLAFPAWTWMTDMPTTLQANKKGVLTLKSTGTTLAGINAYWIEQTN